MLLELDKLKNNKGFFERYIKGERLQDPNKFLMSFLNPKELTMLLKNIDEDYTVTVEFINQNTLPARASRPYPVGGFVTSGNKLAVVAMYIILLAMVSASAGAYLVKRKRTA